MTSGALAPKSAPRSDGRPTSYAISRLPACPRRSSCIDSGSSVAWRSGRWTASESPVASGSEPSARQGVAPISPGPMTVEEYEDELELEDEEHDGEEQDVEDNEEVEDGEEEDKPKASTPARRHRK